MGNKCTVTPSFSSSEINLEEDEPPDPCHTVYSSLLSLEATASRLSATSGGASSDASGSADNRDVQGVLGLLSVTLKDTKNFTTSTVSLSTPLPVSEVSPCSPTENPPSHTPNISNSKSHTLIRISTSLSPSVYTKPIKYVSPSSAWCIVPTNKFHFVCHSQLSTHTTEGNDVGGEVKIQLLQNTLPPLPALPSSSSNDASETRHTQSSKLTICRLTIPLSREVLNRDHGSRVDGWYDIDFGNNSTSDGGIEKAQVRVVIHYTPLCHSSTVSTPEVESVSNRETDSVTSPTVPSVVTPVPINVTICDMTPKRERSCISASGTITPPLSGPTSRDMSPTTPGNNGSGIHTYKMASFNDKYRIGSTIGTGQVIVKKCINKHTSEQFAVKFIPKGSNRLPAARAAFYSERDAMRALRGHPNVVKLHEIYEDAEHVALVMELVNGCDLHDLGSTFDTLRPQLTGIMLYHILSALSFMHSKGFVHHDIKPENVIVDYENKKVKLIDFGSATEIGRGSKSGGPTTGIGSGNGVGNGLSGTIEYLPPETFINLRGGCGGKKLTYKSSGTAGDVWSIGVMTYMLLSGNHPFDSCSEKKKNSHLSKRIIAGKFDFPSPDWDNIPETCKDFIRKCLVTDPKQRPIAADMLKHPWLVSSAEEAEAGAAGVTSTGAADLNCGADWFTGGEKAMLEKRKTTKNSDSLKSLLELFSHPNIGITESRS